MHVDRTRIGEASEAIVTGRTWTHGRPTRSAAEQAFAYLGSFQGSCMQ